MWQKIIHPSWKRVIAALLIVTLAISIRLLFMEGLENKAAYLTFYPAVALAGLYGGFLCGLFATALSALGASYFWIEPVGQLFAIGSWADLLSMYVFLCSCLFISSICEAWHWSQRRVLQQTLELKAANVQLLEIEEELKAGKLELEQKVSERTIDLQEMNAALEEEIAERKAVQEDLECLKADLEEKVAERTQDLQEMNATLEEEIAERKAAQEALGQLAAALEEKVEARTISLQEINETLEAEVLERKTAQEALQETKSRYEVLMKQSSEAMAVTDFSAGHIMEVNESFIRMFGYHSEEVIGKTITSMGVLTEDMWQEVVNLLDEGKISFTQKFYCRRKNNETICLERDASLILYEGHKLILHNFRDITEQQKLQLEIQTQVELAGLVQKSLLTPDFTNQKLVISTIFKPLTLVSGDFYSYRWSHDESKLHGYLIDATGHGVATSLHTSAMSSLLNDVMDQEQPWKAETLDRLNRYVYHYFQDNQFVAMIAFSIDIEKRQMTVVSSGINYVLASTGQEQGMIQLPGIYLGVVENPIFRERVFSLQNGDTFYFMTDGLYERVSPELFSSAINFPIMVTKLERLAEDNSCYDDCTALCIQFTGLKSFPCWFNLSDPRSRISLRKRIRQILVTLTREENPQIEVALGEAVANGSEHGTSVVLKVNKIGQRLILRVADHGPGFAGNEAIAKIAANGLREEFIKRLDGERGRGILLMVAWSDRIIYNRQGNEVMLIKQL